MQQWLSFKKKKSWGLCVCMCVLGGLQWREHKMRKRRHREKEGEGKKEELMRWRGWRKSKLEKPWAFIDQEKRKRDNKQDNWSENETRNDAACKRRRVKRRRETEKENLIQRKRGKIHGRGSVPQVLLLSGYILVFLEILDHAHWMVMFTDVLGRICPLGLLARNTNTIHFTKTKSYLKWDKE